MNYIGEHLLPGQLGHFFAVLSLVASLIATVAFFKANNVAITAEKQSWLRIARVSFLLETVSVITVISCIYYILSHHLFEYKYAWEHSDRSLQTKYILSCLWEGQEGSFLLWSFWHCVLGWILIWKAKNWEAPVMTVISFAQFCLATMIIGIYFFNVKVGSSPFLLLREGDLLNAPAFLDPQTGNIRADYLSLIRDGSGLNALLQNYWMVIHPPVLFLGFASTIVPFAFAFGGLMNRDQSWTKPAIPWTAFSVAALGTGIMMGAAWAYESLTFGGYWAWDPVENASLVPWLVLVAGLHTNLIYKHSGYSLKSTYLFYILGFALILYSTFLTRSGILGDTSVHAFTGADMNTQLLLFIFVFLLPALFLFFKENKHIPVIHKEENTYSREFWMFIGSLVFFLAAIIIIFKTSFPVINKLFGTNLAQPEDVEFSFNQIQIFIAVILGILTAVTQYLKYKDTPKATFGRKILLPTAIALAISLLITFFGNVNYDKKGIGFLIAIHLAIFAAVYAVVANTSYIWQGLKGKIKAAGASVAHIGFGLVLIGILISSSKKTILSWNTTGISPLSQEDNRIVGAPAENLTLFKGVETDMGRYLVTYVRDTLNEVDRNRYFELLFKKKDGSEQFYLYPDIFKNNKGQEGSGANPDSKHYLDKDIFVYITSWNDANNVEDTASFRPVKVRAGDTLFYSNGLMVLNKVDVNKPDLPNVQPGETTMSLDMTVISKNGSRYPLTPLVAVSGNNMRVIPDTVAAQSLVVKFNKVIDGDKGELELGVKESAAVTSLITLKVYEFPFINVLWIGIIVMMVGLAMSIIQRNRKTKSGVIKNIRTTTKTPARVAQ
jgi:cytochrome c-type biogenesis protein CcmF